MTPHGNPQELRRRFRYSGEQNHRCAICTTSIEPLAFSDDPVRACLIAFDPEGNKNSFNTIAVCPACAGECGNSDPLTVWKRFMRGDYIPTKPQRRERRKKLQIENPATIPAIKALVGDLYVPSQFRFAPVERAPAIAATLLSRQPRQFRKCRGRVRSRGHHLSLSEAQNHRCAYCTERMSDDRLSPRFATIEHVVEQSKGGKSVFKNLVMACLACNMMRSRLGMTAEEYAEFSRANPQHILAEISRLAHKRFRENKRVGVGILVGNHRKRDRRGQI